MQLQTPIGRQEVWAAGVTYKRSEEAREAESSNSTILHSCIQRLRPELFFKSPAYHVVGRTSRSAFASTQVDRARAGTGPRDYAELEVVGFTIGNDMSSRDIEGENPLYLPQAKIYDRACALGPRVWLQPGTTAWPDVKSPEYRARRQYGVQRPTSTASLKRTLPELIEYLGRRSVSRGVRCCSPARASSRRDDFTLLDGDTVRICIDPIGELVNTVCVVGKTQEKGKPA